MTIATLTDNPDVSATLNSWFRQYCALYQIQPEIIDFPTKDQLLEAGKTHRLDTIFLYLRGPEGFLHARRIREEHPNCNMIFVADTTEYAVQCMRLHFTDYMLLPLEFKSFVRAMKLSGIGS